MPAGRPPLDPEIKHQHRQESLKRYAAKNADVLRAKAKARMSIVRAKVAEMDWKEKKLHRTRVAEDSERYRDRQDQKEREKREYREAAKTKKRHVERNILRNAHGLPPLPPNQHGPRAPHGNEVIQNPRRERSSRADTGMKGWKAFHHRRQTATALPEPNNDDTRIDSDDSGDNPSTRCAATPPIYEGGMTASTRAFAPARCPECNCEGCPGCICMCPASTDWIEHADGEGHFFPTCTECGGDDCPGCSCHHPMPFGSPPYDNGTLLCTPIYSPDAGHEDREAHTGSFFAVIHDNWKGVVTSQYPGARTFRAFTWSRLLDLWTLDCAEYHEHENETPEVRARAALRLRQHLRSVAHYEQLVAADKEIREEEEEAKRVEEEAKRLEEAKRVKREEMAYLAATRPPPVPLSPQRARQLFDRVLGLGAGSPPPSMVKTRAEPASPGNGNPAPTATAPQTPPITPPQTPARIAAFDGYAHIPTTRLSGLPPYTDVQEFEMRQAPALYAVHANGHNRVFNNRARAVEVLGDTPGGELVFVGDEQNLWRFLDDQ
ncbi:hypothetical protein B0H14DRAFT_2595789 [Mycena olivaceomarginata]|nr:hypothetical protein B0H14DRAFT_2595789 [Mycena olivaceomarginata]